MARFCAHQRLVSAGFVYADGARIGEPFSHRMRTRMGGVLKFDALPNHVRVGCISTHPIRDEGETTMSHDAYGLLEVKEWGRWGSACFRWYFRYDVHTVKGVVR